MDAMLPGAPYFVPQPDLKQAKTETWQPVGQFPRKDEPDAMNSRSDSNRACIAMAKKLVQDQVGK